MNKTYAFSDTHGCYDIMSQMLNYCDDNDAIYFLGDMIDRGPASVKCIETIMNDSRIIALKGNHEQLAINALSDWLNHNRSKATNHWEMNGGDLTALELDTVDKETVLKYKDFFESLPTKKTYINSKEQTIIMEHAGYTPWEPPHRYHDPLWDREHFYDNYYDAHGKYVYMVHGHTPVASLKFFFGYKDELPLTKEEMEQKRQYFENGLTSWRPQVIKYCSGHKIDIDLGTVYTGVAALLDLDTLEPIYFDKEGVIENYG